MLFNGRALIFTFSGTQVRIAEIERLQSLFKMSMAIAYDLHVPCTIPAVIIYYNNYIVSDFRSGHGKKMTNACFIFPIK